MKRLLAICIFAIAPVVFSIGNKEAELISAVQKGDVAGVNKALEVKPDLNAHDKNGGCALIYAVTTKNSKILKMLIDAGADVNAKSINADGKAGNPAIIYAVTGRNTEILKMLIAAKADVNAKTWDDMTPLEIANALQLKEQGKILKAAGAK